MTSVEFELPEYLTLRQVAKEMAFLNNYGFEAYFSGQGNGSVKLKIKKVKG